MQALVSPRQLGLNIPWRKETACRSLLIMPLLGNLPYRLHGRTRMRPLGRDPNDLIQLVRDVDSGDHLHLNSEGYKRMAAAIDLKLFSKGSDTD